jgi:hypothetical protein
MKKFQVILIGVFLIFCKETSAEITLTATTDAGKPTVMLRWNMVNYPGTTAYSLFKSTDGVVWKIVAANPVFRNYTSSTILVYYDDFSVEEKLYYRVKVYDTNENIVEISNTAVVNNPGNYYPLERPLSPPKSSKTKVPTITNGKAWQVAPNPVQDMLNLVYKGNDIINGVINIEIIDETGKVVVRFRAASNNKRLHIPVSKLHTGFYYIKINVGEQLLMNEKFIKE